MILSDRDIKRLLKSGRITVDPAPDYEAQLGSASLDLRLSTKFRTFKPTSTPYIDPNDPQTFENMTNVADVSEAAEDQPLLPHVNGGPRAFVVHPGEFVLGATLESVTLPDDITARIDGRSSLGRLGLVIHSTAGHVNAGFSGTLTLEITNIGLVPILLYPEMRICQLVFETMSSPAEVSYGERTGSKYAGQTDPGVSRIVEDAGTVSRTTARKGLKQVAPKTAKRNRRAAR